MLTCIKYKNELSTYPNISIFIEQTSFIGFEVLIVVAMNNTIFWGVVQCNLVEVKWCSSEMPVNFCQTTWHVTSQLIIHSAISIYKTFTNILVRPCLFLHSYLTCWKWKCLLRIFKATKINTVWILECYTVLELLRPTLLKYWAISVNWRSPPHNFSAVTLF